MRDAAEAGLGPLSPLCQPIRGTLEACLIKRTPHWKPCHAIRVLPPPPPPPLSLSLSPPRSSFPHPRPSVRFPAVATQPHFLLPAAPICPPSNRRLPFTHPKSALLAAALQDTLGIARLLDTTSIYILPTMNPDGYDARPRVRWNANGRDLNRAFPRLGDTGDGEVLGGSLQPEVSG